jgi:hypothetical protein
MTTCSQRIANHETLAYSPLRRLLGSRSGPHGVGAEVVDGPGPWLFGRSERPRWNDHSEAFDNLITSLNGLLGSHLRRQQPAPRCAAPGRAGRPRPNSARLPEQRQCDPSRKNGRSRERKGCGSNAPLANATATHGAVHGPTGNSSCWAPGQMTWSLEMLAGASGPCNENDGCWGFRSSPPDS